MSGVVFCVLVTYYANHPNYSAPHNYCISLATVTDVLSRCIGALGDVPRPSDRGNLPKEHGLLLIHPSNDRH